MNFTQQTESLHVFMPPVVLQWPWWGSGHYVPNVLLQQVLQHPQSPSEGATLLSTAC